MPEKNDCYYLKQEKSKHAIFLGIVYLSFTSTSKFGSHVGAHLHAAHLHRVPFDGCAAIAFRRRLSFSPKKWFRGINFIGCLPDYLAQVLIL